MQFPESWLREFCNPPIDTRTLADLLTMAGLEVEALRPVAPPFGGIVVAQILEAVGLNSDLINAYFTGTASRIEGVGIDTVAEEVKRRHDRAYPPVHIAEELDLDVGGRYQWRRRGEYHLFNPLTVAKLRRWLAGGTPKAAMRGLLKLIEQTENNEQLLARINVG